MKQIRLIEVNQCADIARRWDINYDNVDQLTAIASRNPDTGAVLPTGNYAYTYDKAGNRLTETIDGVTTTASYNALNQLVSMTGGNSASLPNLTYEWDANDRLLAIAYPGTDRRSEFAYDGLGRRSTVTEKTGNTVDSQNKFVWDGLAMLEQRDAAGSAVQKRYFGPGMQTLESGQLVARLFARDHLGSVRSVLSGTAAAATVDYGPWGQRSAAGIDPTSLAFTGHWLHERSALAGAPFRAYSPWQGRWLSRDPIGELGPDGPNLYGYVRNNPTNYIDPTGEFAWIAAGLAIGAVVNVGITYAANGGNVTGQQLAAAAASGAISGALGAAAGPLGGTIARGLLGTASNGLAASVASGALSAGGSALGQSAANAIDPCNATNPLNAALYGGLGGGLAKGLFPTRNLNTWAQAQAFGPKTVGGLFGSSNAWLNNGSFATSAGVGGAANFPGINPF